MNRARSNKTEGPEAGRPDFPPDDRPARRRWLPVFALDRAAGVPLFLQLARAVVHDIRRGRLRAGEVVPGTRPLARALSLDRKTVVAAYDELVAEGWFETSAARATRVSTRLPADAGRLADRRVGAARAARPGYPVAAIAGPEPRPSGAGLIVFASARPDVSLVPVLELGRAYRRVLARRTREVLNTGDPRGHPAFRQALADMLGAVRNLPARPEEIMVVRGSQMAFALVARALIGPGDTVAVEELGYPQARRALTGTGATLVPITIDANGMCVDELEGCARLRAVLVTPHNQFPTTVPLGAERRLALLRLARRRRFAVLEDDADHEFHFEGAPILPLASMDSDGNVIYLGTLSKILAPGLRVGFVVAPPPVIDALAAIRATIDRQGDHALELALAELMEDGEIERHVRRARRIYAARRELLLAELDRFVPRVTVRRPRGGLALWLDTGDVDVETWAQRALAAGVWFPTGRAFHARDAVVPGARLGFGALDERALREGVRRLAAALPRGKTVRESVRPRA